MSGDPTLSWLSYSPWQDRFCHIYPLLRQRSDISLGLLHGEAPWQGQTLQTGLQDDEQRQVVLRGLRDLRSRHGIWGSKLSLYERKLFWGIQVFDRWGYAGGATDDWYSSIGIGYSFTWELPEKDEDGFHGFELPPSNIIRVGRNVYVKTK